jgi:hypothetical protein
LNETDEKKKMTRATNAQIKKGKNDLEHTDKFTILGRP